MLTLFCSIKQESADKVKLELNNEHNTILETFDIKFTDPRGGRKRKAIDVRVKFENGKPIILHVKKNDAKIIIFDVLCLHRYFALYNNT